MRAAGYGFRVLIYQFMKNNTTSERAAMEHLENITFLPGLEHEKFSMRMTEEEKAQRRIFYAEQFRKATQTAVQAVSYTHLDVYKRQIQPACISIAHSCDS